MTKDQIEAWRGALTGLVHLLNEQAHGQLRNADKMDGGIQELCDLALKGCAAPEVARRQVPPELYDGMAVYVELGVEKTETIRPQMVADVLDALMRLIRERWKAEAAESPRGKQ